MNNIQKQLRQDLLELSAKHQAHHLGSCLSCLDILWFLHQNIMTQNDQFILSKGHAAMALYVVMAKKKIISHADLIENFGTDGSPFLAHPSSRHLKDITWSTGALGQGLSVGVGMAKFKKDQKEQGSIYVMVSGGELNCGSTWEALSTASVLGLKNLILLIDNNQLQGLGADKDILDINRQLKEKFTSFGWEFKEGDGHKEESLKELFISNTFRTNPLAISFLTIKGKGIKSIEGKVSCHYQHATDLFIEEFKEDYA